MGCLGKRRREEYFDRRPASVGAHHSCQQDHLGAFDPRAPSQKQQAGSQPAFLLALADQARRRRASSTVAPASISARLGGSGTAVMLSRPTALAPLRSKDLAVPLKLSTALFQVV